ncbi:hypothetical protein N658DRAFT_74791 [Parathielavia hyrcaniae]|uniref:Uncharacterized protein n=1 Tax=Parathielavia hyrcaniae TaxID=113614 RepID=A0AAN6PZR7_9PEZI|nr:hypothetical protein N658DRAFT_74791 [Parathielavia hyrcaniae]
MCFSQPRSGGLAMFLLSSSCKDHAVWPLSVADKLSGDSESEVNEEDMDAEEEEDLDQDDLDGSSEGEVDKEDMGIEEDEDLDQDAHHNSKTESDSSGERSVVPANACMLCGDAEHKRQTRLGSRHPPR